MNNITTGDKVQLIHHYRQMKAYLSLALLDRHYIDKLAGASWTAGEKCHYHHDRIDIDYSDGLPICCPAQLLEVIKND